MKINFGQMNVSRRFASGYQRQIRLQIIVQLEISGSLLRAIGS
jgi:hypothetical protein